MKSVEATKNPKIRCADVCGKNGSDVCDRTFVQNAGVAGLIHAQSLDACSILAVGEADLDLQKLDVEWKILKRHLAPESAIDHQAQGRPPSLGVLHDRL